MKMVPVDSEAMLSVGYDDLRHALRIEFVDGDIYEYAAVAPRVHRELMQAESHGGYFARRIRGRYAHKRIRRRRLESRLHPT